MIAPMTNIGADWFEGTRPDGLFVYVNTLTDGMRAVGVWEQMETGKALRGSTTLRPTARGLWLGECEIGKRRHTVRWDGRVVEFGE